MWRFFSLALVKLSGFLSLLLLFFTAVLCFGFNCRNNGEKKKEETATTAFAFGFSVCACIDRECGNSVRCLFFFFRGSVVLVAL